MFNDLEGGMKLIWYQRMGEGYTNLPCDRLAQKKNTGSEEGLTSNQSCLATVGSWRHTRVSDFGRGNRIDDTTRG
jgi:hypothetical protein